MESPVFLAVALSILIFGFVSRRLETTPFTLPIVFTLFGWLLGPGALSLLSIEFDHHLVHTLAEITLVLVLFTDASRIDLKRLRNEHNLPLRLLGIGLPLTIVLGTSLTWACFRPEMGWAAAAVLATILAPTDAALGQAVVSNPKVPVRIRQSLNVESGLNDGIVLPLILLLVCTANASGEGQTTQNWLQFALLQVILGPLIGAGVGFFGGKTVEFGARIKWMSHSFQDLSALGISLLAYALAEKVGGNGFIAAFFSGLTLGNYSRAVCTCLYEFAEAEGQFLNLLIFMIFGLAFVPEILESLTWKIAFYAILSLTIIRMIPVGLSLIGTRLRFPSVLFLGWFGPRGLASMLFGLFLLENATFPGKTLVFNTIFTVVFFSIFAHGITAYWGSIAYSKTIAKWQKQSAPAEHVTVSEMPVRVPFSA